MKNKSLTVAPTSSAPAEQQSKIKIMVGRLGSKPETHEFPTGITLKEIRTTINAVDREVRVNGDVASDSYRLKDNDLLIIVPNAIWLLAA